MLFCFNPADDVGDVFDPPRPCARRGMRTCGFSASDEGSGDRQRSLSVAGCKNLPSGDMCDVRVAMGRRGPVIQGWSNGAWLSETFATREGIKKSSLARGLRN